MKTLFFVLLAGLFFTSCSQVFYVPSAHNTPMLKEKNDVKTSVATGFGEDFASGEFQLSYAATDSLGIMANGFIASGSGETGSADGGYFEGGAGKFGAITRHVRCEIYAGGGYGWVNNSIRTENEFSPILPSFSGQVESHFSKIFVQPAIGVNTDLLDITLSMRMANLHYHHVMSEGTFNELHTEDIALLESVPNYIMFEPAITGTIGYKILKLRLQFSLSTALGREDFAQETLNTNLGLVVMLPGSIWKSQARY